MKNSQKGFIVPLLIAVIALLVIGGGVYFYQNKKVEAPAVVNNEIMQETSQTRTNTQTPPVATTSSITPTISQIVSSGCTKSTSCAIKIGEKVSIFGSNFRQNAQVQIDDGYYTYEINTNPNTSGNSSSLSFFMARDINPGRHTLQVVNPVVDKFGNPIIQNYKNFITGSNLSNIISFEIQ